MYKRLAWRRGDLPNPGGPVEGTRDDGSPLRARMHRGRTRLGLIVVAQAPVGRAAVAVGAGAAVVSFPTPGAGDAWVQLALAG